jgi:hypothetical protein
MCIDIDITTVYFFALNAKLQKLAKQASPAILATFYSCKHMATNKEALVVRGFSSILVYRYFGLKIKLRNLHSVLCDKWGGRVRLTPQLRLDLQWWNIGSQSRKEHPPPSRDSLHPLQQFMLWLGSGPHGRLEARGVV